MSLFGKCYLANKCICGDCEIASQLPLVGVRCPVKCIEGMKHSFYHKGTDEETLIKVYVCLNCHRHEWRESQHTQAEFERLRGKQSAYPFDKLLKKAVE